MENLSGGTIAAQAGSAPDPFESLPTPSTSNGVVTSSSTNYTLPTSGGTVTLSPGIYYGGITNTKGSATVKLNSGIYVLAGGGITIQKGSPTFTGSNVMFYNTGSNYTSDDLKDSGDNSPLDLFDSTPVTDSGASFGAIDFSKGGATFNVSPMTQAYASSIGNGWFAGILIYQRRANQNAIKFQGGFSGSSGTIYAKWANVTIANGAGATFTGQIIANSLTFSGSALVTLGQRGNLLGQAIAVYLVD